MITPGESLDPECSLNLLANFDPDFETSGLSLFKNLGTNNQKIFFRLSPPSP